MAIEASGLFDFGDVGYREALDVYLAAREEQGAVTSESGLPALTSMIVGKLVSRLNVQAQLSANSELLHQAVASPTLDEASH